METQQVNPAAITKVRSRAIEVRAQADSLQITSPDELSTATDLLSHVKTVGKAIDTRKKEITDPLNKALKSARELFKPIEDHIALAERTIKGKMVSYQAEVERKRQEAAAKLEARVERGTMRQDTAIRKMDAMENVGTSVEGAVGEAQFRTVTDFEITDESQLPREYMLPNLPLIRRAVLDGKEVPGVCAFKKKVVAGR